MSTATLTREAPTRETPNRETPVGRTSRRGAPHRESPIVAPRRPVTSAGRAHPRRAARVEPTRPGDGRPAGRRGEGARLAGTRCAAPAGERRVYARRRAAALAVLVGSALAALVWVVAIVGSNYAASVAPEPVGTEVVHVRQGDSLSSIADRVAPDMPRQSVIDQIVERNALPSSGLRVGQALIAPAYR
ncbi:LysM peptidoglycan-binding domain-containing protein [Gordonia sp. SID5947]|uniref:LysM peptidoglycan-binding domain-containing protein n=1 Tax=Gordonia sp. SID5947 TaxID=2690315 RepID=UPI001367BAE5|nr:LysM peptidoglycan-binding domain-containing protein [Gordonia sp. SID5947]MYR05822.1 LysM peptidoglycan-binding domain-containing protein [Gordonia sp. SID5947]